MQVPERVYHHDSRFKQRGAALIVIMFIIGLAAAALLIKSYNADSLRLQQEEKTMRALGQAKEALIGWAASYDKPGQMPWPDRREVTPPSNYDGQSDCSNVNFNLVNSLGEPNFLGQIPRIDSTAPCEIYSGVGHFIDGSGNNLWYAVSRNLVRNYAASSDPIINPSLAASNPYPWLSVLNAAGQVVSNRVAVVIIAPGPPLAGQNRNTSAPPPSAFLDNLTIGANTYSNSNYDSDGHEFIMGGDVTLNNTFNDRLIFITIDELIHAVEKRAANEISRALLNYQATNGYFPYAAPLGVVKNFGCRAPVAPPHDLIRESSGGFLPIDPPNSSCNYTRQVVIVSWFPLELELKVSVSCDDGFDRINSIEFTKSAANFSSQSGACTRSGVRCTCTGAGSCARGSNVFSCDASGNCESQMEYDHVIGASVRIDGEFSQSASRCSLADACGTSFSRELVCSGTGSGSGGLGCSDAAFNVGASALPAWITTNRWHEYFYYRTSRGEADNLTTGAIADVTAMLIGSGASLVAPNVAASKGGDQVRPSCEVNDYLDSSENADEDLVFDAHYLRRNNNYNDRVYIVAP